MITAKSSSPSVSGTAAMSTSVSMATCVSSEAASAGFNWSQLVV